MLEDADIDNIMISGMVSSGEKNYKYFIGYKDDNYKSNPLHVMPPKMGSYIKGYDGETKWIIFLINDDGLLKKYNDFWNKVSNSIKKELACEPIYNKIFGNQNNILR